MTERRCMKHFIHFLSLCLLITAASPRVWADTWYQVEMILVGYLNPKDMDKETWPAAIPEMSPQENQVTLQYNGARYDGAQLPDLALPLAEYQALQQSTNVEHSAWDKNSQNINAEDQGAAVPLMIPLATVMENEIDASEPSDGELNDEGLQMTVSGIDQNQLTTVALYPDTFYPLASDAEPILDLAAARIARSRDMTVLAHYAWSEQIQSKEQALRHPLKIAVNKDFDIQVVGEFNLYKSRYIHVEGSWLVQHYERPTSPLSLLNKPPCSTGDQLPALAVLLDQVACYDPNFSVDIPVRAGRVQQSRRMRSDEVHYIDHPLMGILVTTRRIEDPRPLPAEQLSEPLSDPLPETGTDNESSTNGVTGNLSSMEISTSIPR